MNMLLGIWRYKGVYVVAIILTFLMFNGCSENSSTDADTEQTDSIEIEDPVEAIPETPEEEPEVKDDRLPTDVDSNYIITFEDDFNQQPGTLPDPSKWQSQLPWGPNVTINSELQYYTDVLNGDVKAPNPFDFDGNGNLIITAGLNNDQQVEATGAEYYSGVLTGSESTPYRDGYIEANIWFEPDVAGFWGAFWLLHRYYESPQDTGENGKRRTEIDWEFVRGPGGEFLGGPYSTDRLQVAYHYDDGQWSVSGSGFNSANGEPGLSMQCNGTEINNVVGVGPIKLENEEDFAGNWHRYGIWKTDEFVKWYLDGELVASICDSAIVSQIDMYPIINLAIGGNFPGPPNSDDYPTSMLIDYITLWEPQ
ncbi:hypothetical protein [Maribacter sp. Asnod1-A12]|uniref:glycoside hydrolase family 16 protein n=1 Tax=Maribacter sp. Asnod1-A12 TaxID=3160576 RepID=UPI003867DE81